MRTPRRQVYFTITILNLKPPQDENFVKIIEPKEGATVDNLFFGHTGNHYVALRSMEKVIRPLHVVTSHI